MPAGGAGVRAARRRAKARAKEAQERVNKEHEELMDRTFARYDQDGSGYLSETEVKQLLTHLRKNADPPEDYEPTDEEVKFVTRMGARSRKGGGAQKGLPKSGLFFAINSWKCYRAELDDPDSGWKELFEKCDTTDKGDFSAEEVKNMMIELTDDAKDITDVDADWVLDVADHLGYGEADGKVTKLELQLALSSWLQKRNADKKSLAKSSSSACTIS
mmetsp:Transcript_90859/g.257368  ORF Transcript_90859/g.257368 Transcript_90859/m.257368 type:complete len:217 (-) Transcript_90859:307-957(-)|eukprot:CAMPEP_0179340134 /NCGR_PEP_ID=MMETSP0797-20121207/69112_1 /TAXON_ID=47934 /ORGANISM="Dinophysis acuminata, Strain DAEP01" /LENGTH=216 /DNA_ID=CAMNT_0021054063 /DNA_START=81 /DNA_END=731 /DNA_ORIENTATION=+